VQVVEIGLESLINSLKDKEQELLLDVLLALHEAGAITSAHVVEALTTFTTQLEDLRCAPARRDKPGRPAHVPPT
jgi:hypothetical protein